MARVVTATLIVAVICVWAAPSPGERNGRQTYTATGGIAIAHLVNNGSFGAESFNNPHGDATNGAGHGGYGGNYGSGHGGYGDNYGTDRGGYGGNYGTGHGGYSGNYGTGLGGHVGIYGANVYGVLGGDTSHTINF